MLANNLIKSACVAGCILLFSQQAKGTVYTATSSGNYSNAATWGGSAPSAIQTTDTIVIPAGKTVTLDQSVEITNNSSLQLNGTLTAQPGKYFYLSTVNLVNGTGTINADSMILSTAGAFNFAGTLNIQKLLSYGCIISLPVNIHIGKELIVEYGTTAISNSAHMSFASGATIIIKKTGYFVGGNVDLTTPYNVTYKANGTVHAELLGTGLRKIELDYTAGIVSLPYDLNIKDTLTINGGKLNTANYKLSFTGNAYLAGATCNIDPIKDLTIDLDDSSRSIELKNDIIVTDTLRLLSGILNTGSHKLVIAGGIKGGSPKSYVATGTNGWLRLQLFAGVPCLLPIGTTARFAPIVITATSGPASAYLQSSVNEGVYAYGNNSSNLASSQPLVNATWYITADPGLTLDVMPAWSAAMEVNGFDRNNAYVANFTNQWDTQTTSAATTLPGNMFSIKRSNITTPNSIIAVMDKNTHPNNITGIATHQTIAIYPNPATSIIHLDLPGKIASGLDADITDITGHCIRSVNISNNNTLSINDMAAGLYNIHLYGSGINATGKFEKR